jgi:non-specific serine/threonine protein kinase/serine/threonine-protein kinase
MSSDWQRIQDLFTRVRDLPSGERERVLQEECGDDPDLLAEVRSLLEHHTDGFLEDPEHLSEAGTSRDPETHPERIGPYKIVRPLGGGGMGLVYLAEQQSPVRRPVALKVIKQGMDTEQVVARFDTERQALALMSHPNIARVYDAGASEAGGPYFVMEYVKGVPITEHCDRQRLGANERLELFLQVCDGLQHAHHKGIIHRDIKASNVLVAIEDDRAVPKIIDFGIAKATDRPLTEATFYTEVGQFIGTPEYMSPEQAELTGQDIDTRTDIYALGVLLYVLLVGDYPFDSDSLRGAGFDELRRIIREDDPPRPSTRFTSLGDRVTDVSRNRRTDPDTFSRELRGDLDWIVMKALEKDRTRRYASAAEFAADIRRHLEDEPVLARPPSAGYRIGKFVRKHRFGVAAAAVVAVALVLGIVGTSVGLVRALRAEDRAQAEAEAARQVSSYLTRIFRQAELGSDPEMREAAKRIIDTGAERIDDIADDAIRRRMMSVMGRLYRSMGFQDEARPLLEAAVELNLEDPDSVNLDAFEAFNLLGTLELVYGDRERAGELLAGALTIGEQLFDDPDHDDISAVLKNLGEVSVRHHDELHDPTSSGDPAVASCGGKCDHLAEARRHFQRSLDMRAAVGSKGLYASLGGLAKAHRRAGNLEEAIRLNRRSVELRRELLAAGDVGPRRVAVGILVLGETLNDAKQFDRAVPQFEEALRILEVAHSNNPRHQEIRNACFGLARALAQTGRSADAEPHFRRALTIDEHNHGLEDPELLESLDGLAAYLRGLNRDGEAAPLEARAARIRAAGGPAAASGS